MSNYKGYKTVDNIRRKANNIGQSIGFGPNNNIKSYSTKIGQLSSKAQAQVLQTKYNKLNKKQPIKILNFKCPIVAQYYKNKISAS